ARLAGFSRIETIQEPVASALASGWSADECRGQWLVYDLGGGTFDASLLEGQEGLLRVIGHDGDNFLGGRDFDLAIVDWLIERVLEVTNVEIHRSHAEHAGAVAKLKACAEEAKIELSRATNEVVVTLEDLEVGDRRIDFLEVPLSKAELDRISAPLVDRSLRVCERLLAAHGVQTLERIVLVGGPTLMPPLRTRLESRFGAPFGTGLDPMLLVAQGAALFAATSALDARAPAAQPKRGGPRLWLQYPAMTPDTSPFVVGRALDGAESVRAVRFRRSDGTWQSDWFALEGDGTFAGMLELKRRASNTFEVEVSQAGDVTITADPPEITLVHGVSIGEPPLARTIGVARADNSVAVYFDRGLPLPMRKTFTLRTVQAVSPTMTDYALRVPIVQGDFPMAHLCRLVGVIEIRSSVLSGPLPSGSVVELTLEVDRGGAMSAKAFLPAQNVTVDRVEQLVAPAAPLEAMDELVVALRKRAAALQAEGVSKGRVEAVIALADFETSMESIARDLAAARGGDRDSAEKARRALIDCDGLLGDVEASNAWPELSFRVSELSVNTIHWVEGFGTEVEKKSLAQSVELAQRALRAKNPREVERQLGVMSRMRATAYLRHPNAWVWELDGLSNSLHEMSDPARAQTLVQRGRRAERDGDRQELQRIVRELWSLRSVDVEERALGFDSGVR
ncbi:MAG TPA: Hsp70 family protein, partial [Polyangiaceae bacterium]